MHGKTNDPYLKIKNYEEDLRFNCNIFCISQLPKPANSYIKEHYKNAKLGDVGKVLDAKGKTSYEVETNRKDIIFNQSGNLEEEK